MLEIAMHHPDLDVELAEQVEEERQAEWVSCPYCDKQCRPGRGLLAHKLKHHKIVPPMSLRTRSTSCVVCGSQLGTRARLLDHLRKKLSCLLWTLANVNPMTLDEYYTTVGQLNGVNNLLDRVLPKTGPIPVVERQFVSQAVAPLDPFSDDETG
eukprot:1316618-Amphidinium_carterae.1